MKADLQVRQQHQFGARLTGRRQRGMVVAERRAQEGLPLRWVARLQSIAKGRQRPRVGRAVIEQGQEAGELEADLDEHLAVAAGHSLGRALEGRRRAERVAHGPHRPGQAFRPLPAPGGALQLARRCFDLGRAVQQPRQGPPQILAPDALPGLPRGPGGDGAPVGPVGQPASQANGQFVVALRNGPVARHGVEHFPDAPDVLGCGQEDLGGVHGPTYDTSPNPKARFPSRSSR